ncbi:peptidase C1A [Kipferlia bialata]|uniref:Peptidase C1A n=1 Tax=Kipferlia bialata TaxID=797122 RepID=A0A9K3GKD6_9EUKA|nr:peptidase C1A [Kipferlia bialata]|eukprot:g7186.t1
MCIRYNGHESVADVELSPQDMLSCSGRYCSNGGNLSYANTYLVSKGSVTETCNPYTASDETCVSTCDSGETPEYRYHNVSGSFEYLSRGYYYPERSDAEDWRDEVKAAVYGGTPVYVSMMSDFTDTTPGVDPIYKVIDVSEQTDHAVTVVGWGEAECAETGQTELYWEVANSWGDWGNDGGYFKIFDGSLNFLSWPSKVTVAYPVPRDMEVSESNVFGETLTDGSIYFAVSGSDDYYVTLTGGPWSEDTTLTYGSAQISTYRSRTKDTVTLDIDSEYVLTILEDLTTETASPITLGVDGIETDVTLVLSSGSSSEDVDWAIQLGLSVWPVRIGYGLLALVALLLVMALWQNGVTALYMIPNDRKGLTMLVPCLYHSLSVCLRSLLLFLAVTDILHPSDTGLAATVDAVVGYIKKIGTFGDISGTYPTALGMTVLVVGNGLVIGCLFLAEHEGYKIMAGCSVVLGLLVPVGAYITQSLWSVLLVLNACVWLVLLVRHAQSLSEPTSIVPILTSLTPLSFLGDLDKVTVKGSNTLSKAGKAVWGSVYVRAGVYVCALLTVACSSAYPAVALVSLLVLAVLVGGGRHLLSLYADRAVSPIPISEWVLGMVSCVTPCLMALYVYATPGYMVSQVFLVCVLTLCAGVGIAAGVICAIHTSASSPSPSSPRKGPTQRRGPSPSVSMERPSAPPRPMRSSPSPSVSMSRSATPAPPRPRPSPVPSVGYRAGVNAQGRVAPPVPSRQSVSRRAPPRPGSGINTKAYP